MTIYRLQTRIPSTSGLAEDDSTNTFHFDDNGVPPVDLGDACADFLTSLWKVDGGSGSLEDILSDTLENTMLWSLYDLSDPEPRVPVNEGGMTLTIPAATTLPRECAIRLGYRAAVVSGVNRARLRGGIWLGPVNATTGEEVDGDYRVTVQVRNIVTGAARQAFDVAQAEGWDWVVYSDGARDNSNQNIDYKDRPLLPAISNAITVFECNNAFDTQRRRGRRPTATTTG